MVAARFLRAQKHDGLLCTPRAYDRLHHRGITFGPLERLLLSPQLRAALENSISLLGAADVVNNPAGRFLQLSGCEFSWLFQGDTPVLAEIRVGAQPPRW